MLFFKNISGTGRRLRLYDTVSAKLPTPSGRATVAANPHPSDAPPHRRLPSLSTPQLTLTLIVSVHTFPISVTFLGTPNIPF
jgi:hypothetical protein